MQDSGTVWDGAMCVEIHHHHAQATQFWTYIFFIFACAKKCRANTGDGICVCSDGQAAMQVLEALRVKPKLVWKC